MTAICHQPPNPQPSPDPSQDHLYTAQATLRTEWRTELDALKQQLTAVQTTVDRLQALIDGAGAKQKQRNAPSPATLTQA